MKLLQKQSMDKMNFVIQSGTLKIPSSDNLQAEQS